MPILVMGLIAVAMFGAIGIMLFMAESAERRQHRGHDDAARTPERAVPAGKHAG